MKFRRDRRNALVYHNMILDIICYLKLDHFSRKDFIGTIEKTWTESLGEEYMGLCIDPVIFLQIWNKFKIKLKIDTVIVKVSGLNISE